MERHVKERLVGAAVLMAAAVILIPEMLSGPERDGREAERVAGETPLKTYTIDLSQPVDGRAVGEGGETRAPPPEDTVAIAAPADEEPASTPQGKPERAAALQGAPPSAEAPDQAPPAASDVVEPPTQAAPPASAPQQSQPALASPRSAPTLRGWAVQLGSFSRQATAERLVNELRAEGHDAFVMPVRSGAATLYRVRVGPMKDRSGAEAALRTLKTKVSGGAVVAHP